MKKTLYDILELSQEATPADIQHAYQRLSQALESGESGLDHTEANFQLNLAKQAHWTLSDFTRRQAYDATLAAQHIETPDIEIPELAIKIANQSPLVPTRILVKVIGSLFALVILLQLAFSILSQSHDMRDASGVSLAEKKVAVKEFEMTNGTTSPDEIAAYRLREDEALSGEEERRQARAQQEADRKQAEELAESRRYAEQVSNNLRMEEEHAQRQAEYQKKRAEQEELMKREAQQRRQEEQKREWLRQLKN